MYNKRYTLTMKHLLIITSFLLLVGCSSQQASIPDVNNWLSVYIDNEITNLTDIWEQRVGVAVVVSADNQVIITMTSANDEPPISESAMREYERSAENIANDILIQYGLQKEYKVGAQFI